MNAGARRDARAALDAARPAVARLDGARGPEDLAADLIEAWSAAEAALRSLVGGSTLTGQALIRDARSRQLINFDQANSLAEFSAVHGRLESASYRPTDSDVNAARSAFLKLDSALVEPSAEPYSAPAAVNAPAVAPVTEPVIVDSSRGRGPLWWVVALGAVAVVALAGIAFLFMRGGGTATLDKAIAEYRAGQREAAVGDFNKAARDDPNAASPHIYLARMAREVGNFTLASQELQTALQKEPNNALALREMGANMLASGQFELARRFYVRALQADPTDKTAQGYLGCALMRLGRVEEAGRFLSRSGQGPWSNCTPVAPVAPPVR